MQGPRHCGGHDGVSDIEAVNLGSRLLFLADGTTYPVTTMLDIFGDETAVESEAVVIIAGRGDHWFCVPLADFETAVTH